MEHGLDIPYAIKDCSALHMAAFSGGDRGIEGSRIVTDLKSHYDMTLTMWILYYYL